jgi:hypothetical protein
MNFLYKILKPHFKALDSNSDLLDFGFKAFKLDLKPWLFYILLLSNVVRKYV